MRYHLTPVRMATIKNLQTINAGEGVEKREPSCTVGGNVITLKALWKTVRQFLKKLNMELPYNPAVGFLGIYPEKTVIQKDTCTTMFIATLLRIDKT